MRKVVAGVCALALAVPALAVAHNKTFESTISIEHNDAGAVLGLVESRREACIANRKVKVFTYGAGATKTLVDTDRTSANGAWSGFGDFTDVDGFGAKVVKRKITRPKGHKHVCGADLVVAFL